MIYVSETAEQSVQLVTAIHSVIYFVFFGRASKTKESKPNMVK